LPFWPGAGFGGCHFTYIQCHTPGSYRIIAGVAGDLLWNILANNAYFIRGAAAHYIKGLVPDWQ